MSMVGSENYSGERNPLGSNARTSSNLVSGAKGKRMAYVIGSPDVSTVHKLYFVDRFYPSSKTCSVCGYKKHDLKLSDREWTCPQCGEHHDRDINAAMNILL